MRNLGVNGDINYSEGFYDKSSVGNSKNLLLSTYKPPQQYVQVDETTRTMDLTYLNDVSKRGFVNTELSTCWFRSGMSDSGDQFSSCNC